MGKSRNEIFTVIGRDDKKVISVEYPAESCMVFDSDPPQIT